MKTLIIGQAPPFQKQEHPYDTTMLYDWLYECGINKQEAQSMFDFEAMSNSFPGFNDKGGHLKPSGYEIEAHWNEILETKVQMSHKIILLGKVASEYFNSRPKTWSCDLDVLELPHPSKRNSELYRNNKAVIIGKLKAFLA